MMKIMVIGSNGFLGKKLVKEFSQQYKVIPVSKSPSKETIQLDATQKDKVNDLLFRHRPNVVIDTVALSSSVACEKNPKLCKEINYKTAKNISKACKKIGSKMIFISSSYVFDGKKGNYSETDKPNPKNKYAKWKVEAEKEVSKLNDHLILRVDLMYGIHKSHIRMGTSQLKGQTIEIGYPNQMRSPIFVEDVPKVIKNLIIKNQKGIFHVAGPNKFKMLEFSTKLSNINLLNTKIKIVNPENWIVESPRDPTLDISKIKSLGLKTTPFNRALKIMKSNFPSNF